MDDPVKPNTRLFITIDVMYAYIYIYIYTHIIPIPKDRCFSFPVCFFLYSFATHIFMIREERRETFKKIESKCRKGKYMNSRGINKAIAIGLRHYFERKVLA